jgi:hypothetical protein
MMMRRVSEKSGWNPDSDRLRNVRRDFVNIFDEFELDVDDTIDCIDITYRYNDNDINIKK